MERKCAKRANESYRCGLHDGIGGSTYTTREAKLWRVEKLANIWYPGQQLAFYLIFLPSSFTLQAQQHRISIRSIIKEHILHYI